MASTRKGVFLDESRYRRIRRTEVAGPLSFDIESLENLDAAFDTAFAELKGQEQASLLEELSPYFGVMWPAGRVLARVLAERGEAGLKGRRVLELGCGLALPSMVASRLGADVLATDYHPDVEPFLRSNLVRNAIIGVDFATLDWSALGCDPDSFDLIVGSDLLYEAKLIPMLAGFLTRVRRPSVEIIVVDPDRPYRHEFRDEMVRRGFSLEEYSQVPVTDHSRLMATIMRFQRPSSNSGTS